MQRAGKEQDRLGSGMANEEDGGRSNANPKPPSAEVMAALRELQEAYAEALPGLAAGLLDAVRRARADAKAKDALEMSRVLSHRLRGTAGSYGFFEISELAAGIEKLVNELSGVAEPQRLVLWERVEVLVLALERAAERAVLDVRAKPPT